MNCILISLVGFVVLLHPFDASQERIPFPWIFQRVAVLETDNPSAGVGLFGSAGIGPSGEVSLVSDHGQVIHQFNADGRWIGNIERHGEGPGEFRSISQVWVTNTGDLLVYDRTNGNRLSNLSPTGEYKRTIITIIDALKPNMTEAGDDRYWISRLSSFIGDEQTRSVSLLDTTGTEVWSTEKEVDQPYLVHQERSAVAVFGLNPTGKDLLWAVDPNGTIWVLTPDQQHLLRITCEGNELPPIATDITPNPMSRSSWRGYITEATELWSDSNPDLVEYLKDVLQKRREFIPAVFRMWWGGDKGLLVDLTPYIPLRLIPDWAIRPGHYSAILVNGSITESIQGPGGIVAVNNGYALSLESSTEELPRLVLYRLNDR